MGDTEVNESSKEPTWMSSVVDGIRILQINAWYIVALAILIYYLWCQKLSSKYYQWKENYELKKLSAKNKKDPDAEFQREEARLSAINRLQEEYNELVVKAKEIKKEKEDKKKQELLNKLKLNGGRKLVDDYFPLSGQGSKGYVSPKRTCCTRGGC